MRKCLWRCLSLAGDPAQRESQSSAHKETILAVPLWSWRDFRDFCECREGSLVSPGLGTAQGGHNSTPGLAELTWNQELSLPCRTWEAEELRLVVVDDLGSAMWDLSHTEGKNHLGLQSRAQGDFRDFSECREGREAEGQDW